MLINKMQTPEDVEAFGDVPDDKLVTILKKTPNYIVNIIADIFMAFQVKAKVPVDIAEANVRRLREKNVAKLFENADFGDLFEKSQTLKEQRKQIAEKDEQIAEKDEQIAEQQETIERGIKVFIEVMQESGIPKDNVYDLLRRKYELDEIKAGEKLREYWKESPYHKNL